ncbi:hypothetical protein EJP77_07285 [Paenibacillus zeisoli]|uniref:Uncharacterized protein n=1 Tax=Paenibacillus zeisoli TaxID=2496267 RepID=A0A3S1DAH6_9BACL|nr:glycosyltransferase family 39 protein [Paenibacillus zeisoli]RUT33444.1 hypothetical protein EJP77_07285 [Paenibacillus zeisoli]
MQQQRSLQAFISRPLLVPALLFVLAVGLRLVYVFVTSTQNFLEGDAGRYFTMVEQLLTDQIYGYGSEKSNARVTPGFPLFAYSIYSIFPFTPNVFRWVHILIGAATVFPVYSYVSSVSRPLLGWLAGLFVAVYPPFIYMTNLFLTETLFIFLLTLFFASWQWMMNKPSVWSVILNAAVLSWAILTRPGMLPILMIAVLFLLFTRPARRLLIPYLLTVGVCFLPWTLRNWIILDEFTLLASDSGNALLSGAYPFFQENPDYKEMYSLGMSQTQYGVRVILKGFKEHFLQYLSWFSFGKLYYMFKSMWVSSTLNFPQLYMYGGVLLHYLTLLLSLISVPYLLIKKNFLAFAFTGMLLFQLLFIPTARYGAPFILLMVLLICSAAYTFWINRSRKPNYKLPAGSAS